MTSSGACVAAREVQVVYQRGGEPAVRDLSFTLGCGEGLLIAGEHGAGKTSALRAVLGLVAADGEVEVLGHRPGDPALGGRIGYGPQGRTFAEGHPPLSLVGLIARLRGSGTPRMAAADALERAGIPAGRMRSRSLDVEEMRRLALACAIAADPEVIVLDDPWEFPETHVEIARARERGAAVLAATHDPGGLPDLLGRTVTLADGTPS